MKHIERIVNLTTGQTTDIERDLTQDEINKSEALAINLQQTFDQEADKATQKAVLLSKLGITEDEARLLLS
jgi:hypothetical protein